MSTNPFRVTRDQLSAVMAAASPVGATVAERNEERQAAVVQFLADYPGNENAQWTEGTHLEMILSDLYSYPEWEHG